MNVKELRKSTGLSQTKFAKKFNIPLITLVQWECETRKPSVYTIEMIEKILRYEQIFKEMNYELPSNKGDAKT